MRLHEESLSVFSGAKGDPLAFVVVSDVPSVSLRASVRVEQIFSAHCRPKSHFGYTLDGLFVCRLDFL